MTKSEKRYYLKNRKKVIERSAKWAKKNPERRKFIKKKWRENNLEKVKLLAEKWRDKNPEYQKQYRIKNREKLKKYNKEYMYKNHEKRLAWQKKYHERTKEKRHAKYYANVELSRKKSRENNQKHPYRKYRKLGIDIKEIELKKKEQNGFCAICKSKKFLCVDHCHKKNEIRGFLCRQCNAALGLFKDDVSVLKNAVLYLSK